MKRLLPTLSLISLFSSLVQAENLAFVPFEQVEVRDEIWRPRIRTLVRDTLPHAFTQTEVAQHRLRMCADWLESGGTTPKPPAHRFNASDLYKVMEGAALMIKAEPNEKIEAELDRIIDLIARAQQDDGYLYISHIVGNPTVGNMGPRPYAHVIHSHELYNVGHLYEAAVAYARATGKTKLLKVAEKSAEHVNRAFFEGDPNYNDGKPVRQAPGHQEIELGLLKLHQYTGKRLYLDMAKRFLDIRGVTFVPNGERVNSPSYAQQHEPVAEQTEAVGHAVRATYQYAAMAETDSVLGSDDYSRALDAIWHDIVDRKMHLTGGLGAVHGIEGFGPAYELPNKHTYLETCAAVGNVFFNMRMFLKYRDAKFVDVAEIALLNNCLAGIGLDGKSFFYPNPLEADDLHRPRSGWFGTACCPSNIARLIPQVPGYLYAVEGNEIRCALYSASKATLQLPAGKVALRQSGNYPWDGRITFDIDPEAPAEFALHLRIPTWAGDRLVPGELYRYTVPSEGWSITINGEAVDAAPENGFVALRRPWKSGDRVVLELPMPVKANTCFEEVEANRDRVAFSRGPLVLSAEGVDNGGVVQRFVVEADVSEKAKVTTIAEGPLRGITSVTMPVQEKKPDKTLAAADLRLIPYFAWSNRDRSSMITWLPTDPALATPDLKEPANLKFSAVTASHTYSGDTTEAVRQPDQPKSSADKTIRRWTSWPQRGREQWVEIDLGETKTVTSVGAYFYNDKGGVQLPSSWHIEVPDGEGWKPLEIYNTDEFSTLPDTYNTVQPAGPTKTSRLRLVMTPRHEKTCVGLLAVDIETAEKQAVPTNVSSPLANLSRPNVLFIVVDDLNDWSVSKLGGNAQTLTPNFDKLASQSVLFSNAHCTAPACGPSRASTLSGTRPSTSGNYHNQHDWRKNAFFDDVPMLPRYFMNHGYRVVGGGKIFHTNETRTGLQTQGHNDPDVWHEFFPSKERQLPEPSRPTEPYYKSSGHFSFGPTGEPVEKMGDHQMVDWAVSELEREHDKPFFLAAGIYRPHLPWHVPAEFFDQYDVSEIKLPENRPDWRDQFEKPLNRMGESRRAWGRALKSHNRERAAVLAYHACVTYADYELGRLMAALDESPHADNTIVVLWSDHGWHLGEKDAWAKFTLWEESTRIPLLFRTPDHTSAGAVCTEAVSSLDIYPTLLALAGLPANARNEGESLVPLIHRPHAKKTSPAITTLGENSHAVRSDDYRYIRMSDGSEAFIDHTKDPGEWNNLIEDPNYQDIIAGHREWLPQQNATAQRAK